MNLNPNQLTLFPSVQSQQRIATGRNKVILKPGHSLMDWIRLGKSKTDLSGTGGKIIKVTMEELSKHNKPNDMWMSLRGKVYNVTPYLDFHPGGAMELLRGAGIDSTSLFDEVHKWVNAESMLEKCYVGKLTVSNVSNKTQEASKEIPKQELPSIDDNYALKLNSSENIFTEWNETDTELEFYIYDKDPFLDQGLIIEKINNKFEIHLRLQSNNWWFIHFEPKYKLTCNFQVKTQQLNGIYKLIISIKKALPGIWKELGNCLNRNLTFDDRIDWLQRKRSCTIEKIIQITHDTKIYCLCFPKDCCMQIPPGFHVYIENSIDEVIINKPYTVIPSTLLPNNDKRQLKGNVFYLMIKNYTTGFTKQMANFDVEQKLKISNYEGNFEIERLKKAECLIMIAAGTGFTPMASLINYCLNNQFEKKMKLMFFNKTENDILWHRELNIVQENNPNFLTSFVLSKPSNNWNGLTGRIRKEILIDWLPSPNNSVLICICGPNPFTDSAFKLIKDEFGFTDEKIHLFLS